MEQENEDKAGQEHGDGPKDPQEEREREVEGTQAQRPEIASPVHHAGNILC